MSTPINSEEESVIDPKHGVPGSIKGDSTFTAGSNAQNAPPVEQLQSGWTEETETDHFRVNPLASFRLSPSVTTVLERVGSRPISAAGLAQAVFEEHPEYAGGLGRRVRLTYMPALKPPSDWVKDCEKLFKLKKPPVLEDPSYENINVFHGRWLIIGLSLLEPDLKTQLESAGIIISLLNELQEPLEQVLTNQGLALLYPGTDAASPAGAPKTEPDAMETKHPDSKQNAPSDGLDDTVPNWQDDPLKDPKDDLLGRNAFAGYLIGRLWAVPWNKDDKEDEDKGEVGAYSMHIYGPWGSGKSTLLNFLQKGLKILERTRTDTEGSWLVVDFNAWREQHIQPPWWSLLHRIFTSTKNKLSFWNRQKEYLWRLAAGRFQYFFYVIILAWILVFLFRYLTSETSGKGTLGTLAVDAEDLSKILALATTIWGAIIATNRSLLFGASDAAKRYSELTADPANKIRQRFSTLIKRLRPNRVVVLIDDLDRCQSSYVVELLEGIQTLFRDAPVMFVIAADRNWLNACYEEHYTELNGQIREPGKELGTLFLEKAFRFSTSVPGIPEKLRESYWRYLLGVRQEEDLKKDIAAARDVAKKDVSKAKSESDIRQMVENPGNRSFAEQRAYVEEAVVKLASPEVIERTEHTLKRYAYLLEPNPRAMKLLVNSYSCNRALAILSEVKIELHQLALWTILSLRWPKLSDYLTNHPDMLAKMFQENGNNKDQGNDSDLQMPADLISLAYERSVREILMPGTGREALKVETIKLASKIRA